MPYDFEVTALVPATPEEVYDAWLSSERHSAMTGGRAEIDPRVGGAFSAWDGYISGTTLELERPRRIVQRWRTTSFAETDEDSHIEVTFEAVPEGTRLTVRHSNVPTDHRGYEDGGWTRSYFEPMRAFFAGD